MTDCKGITEGHFHHSHLKIPHAQNNSDEECSTRFISSNKKQDSIKAQVWVNTKCWLSFAKHLKKKKFEN